MVKLDQQTRVNKTTREGALDTIGDPPLICLRRYLETNDVQLYARLEDNLPGEHSDDRSANVILEEALHSGFIDHNTTIIESTSGNVGVNLAQLCCYYGLPLICVVDPNTWEQDIAVMQTYGAVIEKVTQPLDGDFLKARHARVLQLLNQFPDSFWPNQYANRKRTLAPEYGTVQEIDRALNGRLDYLFVATSSSAAHGCRKYLKKQGRGTKVIAVDIEQSKLFGDPENQNQSVGQGAGRDLSGMRDEFDEVRQVTNLDCVVGCRRLVEYEALLAGRSAGGVLETIRSMIPELRTKVCGAILEDSGTRYLDTIYSDQWVKRELGCSTEELQVRVEQPSRVGAAPLQRGPRFPRHLIERLMI